MKRRDFMKSVVGSALALSPPVPRIVAAECDVKKHIMTGYAAKFGAFTEEGFPPNHLFRERIQAGAFDEALANKDMNVICARFLDTDLILGSTKDGTLRLSADAVGLRFELDLPYTNVLGGAMVSRLTSFAVAEDDWQEAKDGMWERTIKNFKQIYLVMMDAKQ